MSAWEEHMRADPNLRMPMYNYAGTGSKISLGHLFPQRWLAPIPEFHEAFFSVFEAKDRGCTKDLLAWGDNVVALSCARRPLETVRYNGPYTGM